MTLTDRRVREAFIELTDTLVTDFDIIDFLQRLAVRCTELLGVSACGVLLADHLGVLNLVAASTEQATAARVEAAAERRWALPGCLPHGQPRPGADLGAGDPPGPCSTVLP